jgi:F-type H+-transporting ATPase subunit delta
MPLAVAKQYAKALLELVSLPGSTLAPEAALDQLNAAVQQLKATPELRAALLSPAIRPAQKTKVIGRVCELSGFHALVRNFLCIVTSHRRVPLLASIGASFREQLDEQLGLIRADITAARALTDTQKQTLETKLTARTGGAIRCSWAADEALLGGVMVKMGSLVLDGSVRGELNALRHRLVAEA